MNDLINRSELNDVIDELEIYADGRLNTSKVEVSILQLRRWINKLKNIPTAYDIDNVVEELKTMSQLITIKDMFKVYENVKMVATDTAIEIVKAGVKNKN